MIKGLNPRRSSHLYINENTVSGNTTTVMTKEISPESVLPAAPAAPEPMPMRAGQDHIPTMHGMVIAVWHTPIDEENLVC
jgi:hypothetical protein